MAPRPHHLVLRAVLARRAWRGISALPSRLCLPVQFLLRQRRSPSRPSRRGDLTRPSADEITAYRRHVDAAVVKFLREATREKLAAVAPLVEVGLNHEQQHQELMLTDILHAFAQNPICPSYDASWHFPAPTGSGEEWVDLNEGIHTIGHPGTGFHFDNEGPAHRTLVGPVRLSRNLVTNAEWLDFMKMAVTRRPRFG